MNYKFNWDNGVFAVPDNVSPCLKLASGKAVKVLLYLLYFKTEEGMLEYLDITEEDLEDAVSYWISVGVISKDGNFRDSIPADNNAETEAKKKKKTVSEKRNYDIYPEEIAERIEESDRIKELFAAVENILGRTIKHWEQRAVINMTDDCALPPEVVIMIFGYCASIGKTSVSYAEKIAAAWSEDGINTVPLADAKILSLQKAKSLASKCAARMFDSARTLTKKESEYVNKWAASDIGIELIMNAYDRTVEYTGKASFPYMDSILTEWKKAGVSTSEEADRYCEKNKPSKNKKSSGKKESKPSFDLDLIMEHAKNTPLQNDKNG